MGGYPDGGVLGGARSLEWQHNYLALMCQRDLPNWGLPAKPRTTMRLLKMLAAQHGQLWNASQLGKSLGLSYHTVNSYVAFPEEAFLLRRLPPFSANLTKRLVKSPRLYWRDSGLLHALLALGDGNLRDQPWVGQSWEGWIIEQLLSFLEASGARFEAYHFRTSDQKELDLLLERAGQRWAFEIELTSAPSSGALQRLKQHAELVDADRAVLLSQTPTPVLGEVLCSVDLEGALEMLGEWIREA